MSLKPLSEKQCFDSYKAYEAYVEKEVKAGRLPQKAARAFLSKARKNYSNQSYNKQLDKLPCA